MTDLVFTSKIGIQPDPQTFYVNWIPKSSNVVVTNSALGLHAFPATSGAPTTGTISGGTGIVEYVIQPPAMTEAETDPIIGDPFLEKASRVDFMISNGMVYQSKSIFLRQINYNLVPIQDSYYLMDGEIHSFIVKANCGWTAELIDDGTTTGSDITKPAVTQLITTSGGYNTTAGDIVQFRTCNDLDGVPTKFTGEAKIRFTSRYGEFDPIDVTLTCASGVDVGESNSYILKPGGIAPMIPISQANKGSAGQININDIFTAELLWTDVPSGLSSVTEQPAAISRIVAIQNSGGQINGKILVVPGTKEENAVIVLKVGGVIKWSWHLWVTNYDPELPENQNTFNDYIFMDRALGAFVNNNGYWGTTSGESWKYGLYYQWGRKDPFPGVSWNGSSANGNPRLYGPSGYDNTLAITPNIATTLAQSILSPLGFGANGWRGSNGNNSWNSTTNTKTPYDPCPIGWRVAPDAAWNTLAKGALVWNRGFTWPDAGYYPAGGYRTNGSATIYNVGTECFYFSSKPHVSATSDGATLYINNSGNILNGSGYHRGTGMLIRCVKEY